MQFEGLQVGHYQLQRCLGEGGMGTVYLAADLNVPRQVALKVIRIDKLLTPDPIEVQDALRLFRHEAVAIARLNHPHIVPLLEFDGEAVIVGTHSPYMVMPYYSEGSLKTWLDKREHTSPLSLDQVVSITLQAAGALQYAHDQGIIHRDVKLANFLVRSRQGTIVPDVLLTDFGIAALMDGTTSTGQILRGSFLYMAPERWKAHTTCAIDQYALAVVTYQLLTGRLPFRGDQYQLMQQHFNVQPRPPSALNPAISSQIDAVILKALAKDPERRFANVQTFADALQQACQSFPITPQSKSKLFTYRISRRTTIGMLAGLTLIAASGGILWWIRSPGQQRGVSASTTPSHTSRNGSPVVSSSTGSAGSPAPQTTMPSLSPTVSSISVLYQADWSKGLDNWNGGAQWKVGDGTLSSDGSGSYVDPSGTVILAPYRPQISNYAIEAQIQIISIENLFPYFGLLVRVSPDLNGYLVAVKTQGTQFGTAYFNTSPESDGTPEAGYTPGNVWHTYRVEVRDNTIKLFIGDNGELSELFTVIDKSNTYPSSGQVGLANTACHIAVRTFKVMTL